MSALTRSQDKLAEVREELERHLDLCKQDGLDEQAWLVRASLDSLAHTRLAVHAAHARYALDEERPVEF